MKIGPKVKPHGNMAHINPGIPDISKKVRDYIYTLIDKAFNCVMEEQLNENLTKCKGEVAILRQLSDFMVQKKFAKAKEH